ncbi:neither inactivation nor afterpotential protein C [Parasteatoda tepidariorum]|uniref:neither inactivation nor afterpotential protein C n=1 Tax=Parasteatoda tepidariorum TaxID=114398 RepID=UPI001C71FB2C|nr:neither inactivation nor afterpotential protein C [Parasteatoda tepidariorum]
MLQDPKESSCSTRRKSMDPVSQFMHLEELPTPGSRFELQELIGVGTCAKIYAAFDKQKGNKVAVKVVDNIAENILEIESEYRVLTSIGGNPYIPEFHGTYLHLPKNAKRQLWFVMEFCEGVPVSELLCYLRKEEKMLTEEEIAALLKLFLLGLQTLHENEIIHRDVRASNFIISPEGDIKFIDFGSCALVKDTDGKTHSSLGAPYWMAPEVIACEQMRPYTKSCDVWSLGITAIELAETVPPYSEIHPVRAMFQIARNPPPTLKKSTEWSETFKDFISECLERNAEHRPCVLELLFHPFITMLDDATNQSLTLEEHLKQQCTPALGCKIKRVLKSLGDSVKQNLTPAPISKPISMTVKNWHFKSDADTSYVKLLPDDLAANDNLAEESVVDYLHGRFMQDNIYTFIGDILIAVNPRKKLPLYDSKIQTQYWEKARSDNPPHVFAIADRAYQQMLHHKRSQVIITFGQSGSGKSFSTTQIINQLAFLSPSSNLAMAEKIQQLCPLLDAFGTTRTTYNQNASRLLKTVGVTFTKMGKITGGMITATLLDRTRISSTPQNESNFHILYCVYEGLKNEKRLAEFGLDKLSSMRYLPQKTVKNPADLIAGYKNIYQAFRVLSFTEEEILVVLRILAAILLLGDVTYTLKGSAATANNPYLITSAAKNLSVDHEKLCSVVCKGVCVEDVVKKRDSWVQFLFLKVFDWIVSSINKQLSFSRLVLGDSFSVTVIDPPGFGTNEHNQLFRLSTNIINDFLQNYIQQLMFFKELQEYKEEGVDMPFKWDDTTQQEQSTNCLVECERILLNDLQNSSGVNWLKKMKSLPAECIEVENDKIIVHHIFEKVLYSIPDLTAENMGAEDESEFIETFKNTDDVITAAIANKVPTDNKCLTEQTQILLPKILDLMTEDFPHLVVCLQPSQKEDARFEPPYIMQQLRAFNLTETILIRQKGFARRLSFPEFLNRYKYLAFDFDEEVELNKDNCQLLLIRLKMDGWKMGTNKVFLKYYAEEYLSRLYETHVKRIVKVQAMARRFIVKARQGRKQTTRKVL